MNVAPQNDIYCMFDFLVLGYLLYQDPAKPPSPFKTVFRYLNVFAIIVLSNAVLWSLMFWQDPELAFRHYSWIFGVSIATETVMLAYVYNSRSFYIDGADALFRQIKKGEKIGNYVELSPKESFRQWYFVDHIKPMYGFIDYDIQKKKEGRVRLKIQHKVKRIYWILMLSFIVIWMAFAMTSHNQRLTDVWKSLGWYLNALIYWSMVSYVLRVIVSYVSIINSIEFEIDKLSAPVAHFKKDGFNFFIRAWRLTMIYFLPFWLLFWLYTSLAYQHTVFLDSIYVISALGLAGFWSIRITMRTFMLSRRIIKKSLRVLENNLIEKKDFFINKPTQIALYDLEKTINLTRRYEKMMFKDMKPVYTISVLLNLWVLIVPVMYWLYFCLPEIIKQ